MNTRSFARVEALLDTTKHYIGFPPALTGGKDERTRLPPTDFVILESNRDGFYILRYTATGVFAGDTLHASEEEAKAQAVFEYRLSEWLAVPDDVRDAVDYVVHGRL